MSKVDSLGYHFDTLAVHQRDYLTNLLLSQGLNPYNQSPAHLDGFLHSRQTVQ